MSKKTLLAVVASAAVAALSAGPAFAGEVTGKPGDTKPTGAPANSNSICSFSGQNDRTVGEGPTDTRVQTPAEGPPGAPGHGTCAGGSNHARQK